MPQRLSNISISESDEDYLLYLEDEAGTSMELIVSYEQLDLIVETIDDVLDRDEEEAMDAGDLREEEG